MTIPQVIRYGVPIKLRHVETGHALHSHPIKYESGSRQQEITGFEGRDENDWWIIKGPHSKERINAPIGTPVTNNSILRLEHLLTGKNLHSHPNNKSPASLQGEVTGYGEHGVGDDNDNWRIEISNEQPGDSLRLGLHFRLIHVKTNYALHSHHEFKTRSRQQEVTGYEGRDNNDLWQVEVIA